MQVLTSISAIAMVLGINGAARAEYDLGCKVDEIATLITWCIDPAQKAQTDVNQANAYAQQIVAKAGGEAAAFDRVYVQYKASPEVTRRRMYYETMERVLAKVDKTIVEPGVTPYLPLQGARSTPPAITQGAGQ